MKTVSYDTKYSEPASRAELIVRIVYFVIGNIVLAILKIISLLAWIAQLLMVLFTGKRDKGLNGFMNMTQKYGVQLYSYMSLLTDERPPLLPE